MCEPAGVDRLDRVGVVAVVTFALLAFGAAVQGRNDLGSASPSASSSSSTSTSPVVTEASAEDVDALVTAWARTRTMTHRSIGTFERVNDDGQELRVPTEVVQRAPDRLLRGFQEVSGRRDDRVLSCPAPLDGGEPTCSLGPPGPSFDDVVADEVAAFRALVGGEDPLYRVETTEPGCWRMIRTRFDPRSGYGQRAALCFDAATGALVSIEIDHGDVVETTRFTDINLDVDDADLEP